MRNPEKLKQAIADMHKSLKEDKATVSLSEKKSRELHSKIQMMTLVEEVRLTWIIINTKIQSNDNTPPQDIKTCRELMDVCQSSKEKAAKALKKLENEKDNLEAKKSEQRELDIREQVTGLRLKMVYIAHCVKK